jgi:hypothetical protein
VGSSSAVAQGGRRGRPRLRALFVRVDAALQRQGVGRGVAGHGGGAPRGAAGWRSPARGAMSLNAVPFYLQAGFRAARRAVPGCSTEAGVRVPAVGVDGEERLRGRSDQAETSKASPASSVTARLARDAVAKPSHDTRPAQSPAGSRTGNSTDRPLARSRAAERGTKRSAAGWAPEGQRRHDGIGALLAARRRRAGPGCRGRRDTVQEDVWLKRACRRIGSQRSVKRSGRLSVNGARSRVWPE